MDKASDFGSEDYRISPVIVVIEAYLVFLHVFHTMFDLLFKKFGSNATTKKNIYSWPAICPFWIPASDICMIAHSTAVIKIKDKLMVTMWAMWPNG